MGRDKDRLDSGAWRRHMRPIFAVLLGLITVSAVTLVAVEFYDQAYIAAGVNGGLLVVTGLLGGIGVLIRHKGLLVGYAVIAVLWAAFALFHMLIILNLVTISGLSTNPAFVGSADASYIAGNFTASATASTHVVLPATTSSFATSLAARTSPATATAVVTTAPTANPSASLVSMVMDSTISSPLAADVVSTVAAISTVNAGQRRDPGLGTATGTAIATTTAFGTTLYTASASSTIAQGTYPTSTPTTTYLVAILYGFQALLTIFSCISALLVQTAKGPNSQNTMQLEERYDPPPPSRGTVFVAGGKGGEEYGYHAFNESHGRAPVQFIVPPDPVAPAQAGTRLQPAVVDILAPSTVDRTAAEPVDILAPSINARTPTGPFPVTPTLTAVSVSPMRPPRQARGGQSAAAIAAAAAEGAAPKKYQAGPHNAPAAVPVMRNQSMYSVYTIASNKHRDSDTSRLVGDEESNLSSISTAPVITHLAPAGNPNGRGREVGLSGAGLSRSDSGKEPKVRCKYCNEKMPLSQSSSHMCPIKDSVQKPAVPEIAPMKKVDGPVARRERSQSIVASRSRSKEREAAPQEKLDGKRVKASKRFAPQMTDELAMEIGDTILVEASFEDNWAVGTNQVTDEYGAFPLNCVSRFPGSEMDRVQSIYGAARVRNNRR